MVGIRPADPSDVEGIRRVARRAWHEAHEPIIGRQAVETFLDRYYNEETVLGQIEDGKAVLEVAVASPETVDGFASVGQFDDENVFDLSRIYVDPDRWGKGIGQELLAAVERKVAQRGGERIELGVMAANDRAIDFYESAGYERTGEFYDDRIDTDGYEYVKDL